MFATQDDTAFDTTGNYSVTGDWKFSNPIQYEIYAGTPDAPTDGFSTYSSARNVETRFFKSNGFKHSYDYQGLSDNRTITIPDSTMTMLGVTAPIDSTYRSIVSGGTSALSLSTAFVKIEGTGVASGGGVVLGSYNLTTGGVWSSSVTPSTSNYALAFSSGVTFLSGVVRTYFGVNSTTFGEVNSSGWSLGSGSITQNGLLTVKGGGANIQSWRDSSNVERFYIDAGGALRGGSAVLSTTYITNLNLGPGNGVRSSGDGKLNLLNSTFNGFSSLTLGLETALFPMLKLNGAGLEVKLGDNTDYTTLTAKSYLSANLSSGALTTARPFKVGDKATITDGSLTAIGLDTQFCFELDGTLIYVPGGSAQFA
ncbi:MAG: hypothetical protein K9I36_16755 [Bacteroidia bacterium]|nr:hypothetical protein [Bacteroidia bacterium]